MNRLILLIILASSTIFYSQGIYFDLDINHIDQDGWGSIEYNFFTDNCTYVQDDDDFYAQLKYPDGSISNWLVGEIGGWWVNKAGTYQLQGKAYAYDNCLFTGWAWRYRWPFDIVIYDNYAPAVPANFSGSVQNNYPSLSWSANTEGDFDYYEIWRKWDEGEYQGTWTSHTTTTSTGYTDYGFYINGKPYAGTVYYKIKAKDINGHYSGFTSVVSFSYTGTTWKQGIDITIDTPKKFMLASNYPNPFNPTTRINFQIPKSTFVRLNVYNSLGQEIAILINDFIEQGSHSIEFNAKDLPSGIYIYKLQADQYIDTKKMILTK